MDPLTESYQRLFTQRGGDLLPVFRGSRYYHHGSGFGDILRGIFRFILPVAIKGASTFLGETSRAHDLGVPMKEALKAAIKPTLGAAATEAVTQFAKKQESQPIHLVNQKGQGKKRKKKKKKVYKEEPSPKSVKYNF